MLLFHNQINKSDPKMPSLDIFADALGCRMEVGEELVERQDDQEERQDDQEERQDDQEESIEDQETEEEKLEEKSVELDKSEQQPARREGGEVNYRLQVLEEICLEGLEGITLQVLPGLTTLLVFHMSKVTFDMCGYISLSDHTCHRCGH